MRRLLLRTVSMVLFTSSVVDASEVTGTFSGQTTHVDDASNILPPEIAVGASVSGVFRYETAGVTETRFFNVVQYEFPDGDLEISVTVANHTWTAVTSGFNRSEVANDEMTLRDELALSTNTATALFPFNQGRGKVEFDIRDESPPYELVDDTELPLTNADLNPTAADAHRSIVWSRPLSGPGGWTIRFDVSAVDLSTPLPVSSSTWSVIKDLFR